MNNTQLQLLIMGQDKQPKAASSDRKTILQRTIEEGNQFYTTASRIIRRISTAQRLKLKNKKLKGEKEKKKKKSKMISKQNEKRKKDEKKIHKVKEHKAEQKRKSYNEMKFSNKKDDFKQLNGSVSAGKELNSRMWNQKQNPFPNIGHNSCKINISNIGKTATLSKCRSESPQNPKFEVVDVCFCIDATGSMAAQIYELQNVIAQVVRTIENIFFTQGMSLRFAVVSYRDHNPQDKTYVTKFLNFTDQQEAINYLKTLHAFGGGDQPEAVHDGLLESVKSLNWGELPGVPVLRYIIHIADAQPHGKQFGNDEVQNGCTCGIQTQYVIKQINKHNIQYALMKVRNNSRLDQMQKIFKEKLGHFTSFSIKNPKQLEKCISNLIKMDMLPS